MNKFIRPSVPENLSGNFWWLSPEGKFYSVASESHIKWARDYLTKIMHLEIEPGVSPYHILIDLGWMRVGIYEDWLGSGEKESVMEYDCKRDTTPPTSLLKKIKILAREKGILWMKRDREKQVSPIDENFYKKISDNEHDEIATQYFDIGHEDNDYCWIWNKSTQSIIVGRGRTHATYFGHTAKEYTFSGWYDTEKNTISFVFPDSELRKFGDRRPTQDDIPQQVYSALIRKFGKRNPNFVVFESKINETVDYDTDMEVHGDTSYGGWLDPNLKFHPVRHEQHMPWARKVAAKLNLSTEFDQKGYGTLYHLGFVRIVFSGITMYFRNAQWNEKRPITQRQLKALKDIAVERECKYLNDDSTNKTYTDLDEAVNLLKENVVGLKFWWLDPNLKLHPVAFEHHRYWASDYLQRLGQKVNIKTDNVYEIMYRLGFIRVVKQRYGNEVVLSYQYDKQKPITPKQLKQINDLAIEEQCDYVSNDVTGKETAVLREITLVENLLCEADNRVGTITKDLAIRKFFEHPNDDLLIVTINKFAELPKANYVQIDYNMGGHNIFSTNPEILQKYGYDIPSSEELLTLPTGKFKLSTIKKRLKTRSLREDMSYDDLLKLTTPERKERSSDVNVRSLPVSVNEEKERWNFRYKSSPKTTVTDQPFRGSITFMKGELHQNDDAEKVMCKVDCECPDFMYRFAYNDTAKGASQIGKDSLNKALNRKPKPAYDEGEGLCKHLIALGRFLKTQIAATKKSNLFEAIGDVGRRGPFNVTYYD